MFPAWHNCQAWNVLVFLFIAFCFQFFVVSSWLNWKRVVMFALPEY